MNKKIVSLILVVFCMISVVVLSVFGKVPEDTTRIAVESISFVDLNQEDGLCKVNNQGEKIISIAKGVKEYKLNYIINPSDATDKSVTFKIVAGDEHATITNDGVITFEDEFTIVVKIFSNPSDLKWDQVIIEFTSGGGDIIDPEW